MQQFFSFPVHVSVLGARWPAKPTSKPRVLHFDPTMTAECSLLRFVRKGSVADSVRLSEVHTVAYDEAQPCSLTIVCKHSVPQSRILIDFQSAEDNRLFRVAFASVVLGSFDLSMFHIAPVLVSKVQKRGLTGFSTRHAVLVSRRMLLFDSERSPYPRQVLPLMSSASVSMDSKTRLIHLVGAYGEEVILRCGESRMEIHAMLNAMQTAANISPFTHVSPTKEKQRLASSRPEPVRIASLPSLTPASPTASTIDTSRAASAFSTATAADAPLHRVPGSTSIPVGAFASPGSPHYASHAVPAPFSRQALPTPVLFQPKPADIAPPRPGPSVQTEQDTKTATLAPAQAYSRSASVSEASLAPRRRASRAISAADALTFSAPPDASQQPQQPHNHPSDIIHTGSGSGTSSGDDSYQAHEHHHSRRSSSGTRTTSARSSIKDINNLRNAQSLLMQVRQQLASMSSTSSHPPPAPTVKHPTAPPQHPDSPTLPPRQHSQLKVLIPPNTGGAEDVHDDGDLIPAVHDTAASAPMLGTNTQASRVPRTNSWSPPRKTTTASTSARTSSLQSLPALSASADLASGCKPWLDNHGTAAAGTHSSRASWANPAYNHRTSTLRPRAHAHSSSGSSTSSSGSAAGRAAPSGPTRKHTATARATKALSSLLMSRQPLPSYVHLLPSQAAQHQASKSTLPTSTAPKQPVSRPRVLSAPARVPAGFMVDQPQSYDHPSNTTDMRQRATSYSAKQIPAHSNISVVNLMKPKESHISHKPGPIGRSQSLTLSAAESTAATSTTSRSSLASAAWPPGHTESSASTPAPVVRQAGKQQQSSLTVTGDEVGSWPTPGGGQIVEIRPNLSKVLPGVSIAVRVRKDSTAGHATTTITAAAPALQGFHIDDSCSASIEGAAAAQGTDITLSVGSRTNSITSRSPCPSIAHQPASRQTSSSQQPLPIDSAVHAPGTIWPYGSASTVPKPVSHYVNPLFVRQGSPDSPQLSGSQTAPDRQSPPVGADRSASPPCSSPSVMSPRRSPTGSRSGHPLESPTVTADQCVNIGGMVLTPYATIMAQPRLSADGLDDRHEVPSLGKHASAHIVNAAHQACESLSSTLSQYISRLGGAEGESNWGMSAPLRPRIDPVTAGVARVHVASAAHQAEAIGSDRWQATGSQHEPVAHKIPLPSHAMGMPLGGKGVTNRSLVHRTSWLQGLLHGLNAGDITPHDFLHTLHARRGELLPDIKQGTNALV